jgi:hypothetical protein
MNLIPSRVDCTLEIALRSTPTAASNTQKRRGLSKFLKPSARWKSHRLYRNSSFCWISRIGRVVG